VRACRVAAVSVVGMRCGVPYHMCARGVQYFAATFWSPFQSAPWTAQSAWTPWEAAAQTVGFAVPLVMQSLPIYEDDTPIFVTVNESLRADGSVSVTMQGPNQTVDNPQLVAAPFYFNVRTATGDLRATSVVVIDVVGLIDSDPNDFVCYFSNINRGVVVVRTLTHSHTLTIAVTVTDPFTSTAPLTLTRPPSPPSLLLCVCAALASDDIQRGAGMRCAFGIGVRQREWRYDFRCERDAH
jgi:hypothetical protein